MYRHWFGWKTASGRNWAPAMDPKQPKKDINILGRFGPFLFLGLYHAQGQTFWLFLFSYTSLRLHSWVLKGQEKKFNYSWFFLLNTRLAPYERILEGLSNGLEFHKVFLRSNHTVLYWILHCTCTQPSLWNKSVLVSNESHAWVGARF